MIAAILFGVFIVLMLIGVPVGVALGLGGTVAIVLSNLTRPGMASLTVPQNFYAGLAKYPLLAIPMFVLVGSIFDRSGVARRLVDFAIAIVGRGPHAAAGVDRGGHVPGRHLRPRPGLRRRRGRGDDHRHVARRLSGPVLGRGGGRRRRHRHPDPALGGLHHLLGAGAGRVGAGVFAAGMVPGILAGFALIIPAVWLSRKHKMGSLEAHLPRPPFWKSLREASWGLAAPVLILGGMRMGWFTPTEAAVVAVFYGLFVGMFIHRSIKPRDLFTILREAAELSAVIMLVVTLAGIFAWPCPRSA